MAGAAGDVSVAGSVALALVDHTTTAALEAAVTLTGGTDLVLDTDAAAAATATALPAGDGAAGGSVGIGAAVALVILDVTTESVIRNGIGVTGARDVTLTADELDGTRAYGPDDEDLGTITDVVLGDDGKTVDAVVIDFGGFLGIGTKPVAIAFDTLKFQQDANGNRYVYLNVTRDQLNAAPAFNAETYKTDPAAQRLSITNG